MHHAAGDRPGANDADLDHEIVEISRPQPRQHRHLGAALDLKHADRVAFADHVVGRFIARRDRRHGEIDAAMLAQKLEAKIELSEPAEAEQIDFEQAEIFDIVFVPLDHRALGHRRVLDRHHIVHRLMAEQKTAGMNRQMARKIQNLVGELEQMLVQPGGGVDAHRRQHFRPNVFVGRKKLRHSIERGLGKAQSLADVAQRRARAVAHHVGDHGGAVAAVFLVNMLDHFFAPVMLDVEIDIRRLGALHGNKALEEQAHAHRIDGRDAEAITNHRIRRRAASLAKNIVGAAELDDLPHGQEVAGIIERFDDLQLFFQLHCHDFRQAHRRNARARRQTLCRRSHSADVMPLGNCSDG